MTKTSADLPRHLPARRPSSARRKLGIAFAAGIVAAVAVGIAAPWEFAPVAGWDVAAATYFGWVWVTIRPMDAERTAEWAVQEDPTRAGADALLLGAAVVSLAAVALVLAQGKAQGLEAHIRVLVAVGSVLLSWFVVHTVFTLTYARIYFEGGDGGLGFHSDDPPRYTDFAYVAFTVGMTFQVSDNEVSTSGMRRAILRQALLSYLFGAVILATIVNLIANLRG